MSVDDMRCLTADERRFIHDLTTRPGIPTLNDARRFDAIQAKIRSAKWFGPRNG